MNTISYVYPNVSQMTRKGVRSGLLRRWSFAQKLKCQYVEVPADFAKERKPLSRAAIERLYEENEEMLPEESKYILHTEPVLNGSDILKWYDRDWIAQFADMIIFLSEFLGKPASIIEIHPGKNNSFQSIAESVRFLLEKYSEAFGVEPLILLENRTEQRISRARDIRDFWHFLCERHTDLDGKIGIVLDVQQLFTQEKHLLHRKFRLMPLKILKASFVREFDVIPPEAIKGFHIWAARGNASHQPPSENDEIPWKHVFDRIQQIRDHIIINPEVLHEKWVDPTIKFCEDLLSN